jgi:hypothetical protein
MVLNRFRWVYCQLDNLSRCFPSSIRSAIAELPTTLDDTYERILQGIPKQKQQHALRLFQCIVTAVRPLRVEELGEILAIRFNTNTAPSLVEGWRPGNPEEDVLSACSTLISIIDDEGMKVVQFSHFSVKEFLTSDRLRFSSRDGNIFQYHISLEPAHVILAQACMAILLQQDKVATFPLASYAAEHWVDHAKFGNVAMQIEDAMEDLFNPKKPHLRAWISIHDVDLDRVYHGGVWPRFPTTKATALYYAVSCGFSRLARHLIVIHADDVNAKCDRYGTPLHVASYMGHMGAVRVLLEHGADVEGEASLPYGLRRRPLHLASDYGRMEVVQLLLQHNAEVNARTDFLLTPLHLASSRGHLDVAQLLLKHNANINLRSKVDDTPIRLASQNGCLGVVRLLLRHGADVNTPGFRGLTALQAANEEGHREIAQLLLEHGAH